MVDSYKRQRREEETYSFCTWVDEENFSDSDRFPFKKQIERKRGRLRDSLKSCERIIHDCQRGRYVNGLLTAEMELLLSYHQLTTALWWMDLSGE